MNIDKDECKGCEDLNFYYTGQCLLGPTCPVNECITPCEYYRCCQIINDKTFKNIKKEGPYDR